MSESGAYPYDVELVIVDGTGVRRPVTVREYAYSAPDAVSQAAARVGYNLGEQDTVKLLAVAPPRELWAVVGADIQTVDAEFKRAVARTTALTERTKDERDAD